MTHSRGPQRRKTAQLHARPQIGTPTFFGSDRPRNNTVSFCQVEARPSPSLCLSSRGPWPWPLLDPTGSSLRLLKKFSFSWLRPSRSIWPCPPRDFQDFTGASRRGSLSGVVSAWALRVPSSGLPQPATARQHSFPWDSSFALSAQRGKMASTTSPAHPLHPHTSSL